MSTLRFSEFKFSKPLSTKLGLNLGLNPMFFYYLMLFSLPDNNSYVYSPKLLLCVPGIVQLSFLIFVATLWDSYFNLSLTRTGSERSNFLFRFAQLGRRRIRFQTWICLTPELGFFPFGITTLSGVNGGWMGKKNTLLKTDLAAHCQW